MASAPRIPFQKLPDLPQAVLAEQQKLFEAGELTIRQMALNVDRSPAFMSIFVRKQGWKKPTKLFAKSPAKRRTAARRKPDNASQETLAKKSRKFSTRKLQTARAVPPDLADAPAPVTAPRHKSSSARIRGARKDAATFWGEMNLLARDASDMANAIQSALVADGLSEENSRSSSGWLKTVAELRRNAKEFGEIDKSGAIHGTAGALPVLTADDMARLRHDLATRLARPLEEPAGDRDGSSQL